METQLFSWDSFAELDAQCFAFQDCMLKVPIGPHAAGTVFPGISVDWEVSTMTVYPIVDSEEGAETYDLLVAPGPRRE